jgi:hypothetical protein
MKTLTERLEEIERLTAELKDYVEKYGFAPKDGGMETKQEDTSSCIECGGERFDTGTPGRCKDC